MFDTNDEDGEMDEFIELNLRVRRSDFDLFFGALGALAADTMMAGQMGIAQQCSALQVYLSRKHPEEFARLVTSDGVNAYGPGQDGMEDFGFRDPARAAEVTESLREMGYEVPEVPEDFHDEFGMTDIDVE